MELHIKKNKKNSSYQIAAAIADKSSMKPQLNKHFHFSIIQSRALNRVLVFENSFRKTKIIVEKSLIVRQRRNKKARLTLNLVSADAVLLVDTDKVIFRNNRAYCAHIHTHTH